ncbi:glycosyltransferase [Shimia sp. FJ5]|uniref:glycosyltransferase n=1 Tax=Shimia sp. FJ5 TaxID=3079054 RepID=UPI00293DF840|nr:glycosyltransferase [Shimia sp. FJ5]MDV4145387.1 glycosyltransferase [Shimia sp. FJ5]
MTKKTSSRTDARSKQLSCAVVIHLHYEDQWPDFEAVLRHIDEPFSLFVTLKPESTFGDEILQRFPKADVRAVPNLGRDVAPFLALLPRLTEFDLVCKMHTKRSEGRHTRWRRSLVRGLMGSPETVRAYRDAFDAEPELVLAGPREYYLDGPSHEGLSKKALALQHGPMPERYGFFAGTMFWCRPSAFVDFVELYPQTCFVAHADNDGQPEHVIERAFGCVTAAQDKKIMLWDGETEITKASALYGDTDFGRIYANGDKDAPQDEGHERDPNTPPTLYQLHEDHRDFVSDKWTGNLLHYERLLRDHRDREVRLLEIGVQNGGSLQIWSKYFANGRRFIGCDIDPGCAELVYEDPRISVIVNDAGAPIARTQAMRACGQFDIIIDDGSHQSRDIIRAFLSFFPVLAQDGLFIVEDMSCSFWQEFEGGLDLETSSLAFFKEVANVINREHWQVETSVESRFDRFIRAYDLEFDPSILAAVQSVEILNSMVVIRKGSREQAELGPRMVHGTKAHITGAGKLLNGTYCVPPNVTRDAPKITDLEHTRPGNIAISVVIPFYNGSAFLRDAIASVKAQSLPAREIIVVNDGSDESETRWLEAVADEEDIVLLSQENMGQGGARNTGAKAARGTHLCFLDQDDTFRTNHNEILVAHWRQAISHQETLGWVFADVAQMDRNGAILTEAVFPYPAHPVLERPSQFIARDAVMFPSAALICRESFAEVGGFDPALVGYEDDDLYLRLLLSGYKTSFCPVTVTNWRQHPEQTSRQSVFLKSAEHFFDKWFGYAWGDVEERALADARLKSRLSASLEVHLHTASKAQRAHIWRFFEKVQDARSSARQDAIKCVEEDSSEKTGARE